MDGFDMGNNTLDDLDRYSAWSGIPAGYKDPTTQGWKFDSSGRGPGIAMDETTWQSILSVNDSELKKVYGVAAVKGFRAPRLEVNDNGLSAAKAMGYTYDQSLEEAEPASFVDAAIAVDTPSGKGFNWTPWPYTLDNGSAGIWNQQGSGDKAWVTNYPQGLWEIPVYPVYIPSAGGLGTTIANRMLNADNPTNCTFPPMTPPSQMMHCFLNPGELNPGDSLKKMTGYDFKTFIYCRLMHDEWLAALKHTFLLRYYGNRAPLTYGAYPIEYTATFDNYTLKQSALYYGYRDVPNFNTYSTRQQAMKDFISWIESDATLSKDTYFLSAKQLADYMVRPFDKTGAPAPTETVASPDSNGIFTRLAWKGSGATLTPISGNAGDIVFNVPAVGSQVDVGAAVTVGSLANVSHIDIQYNTEVPFRIRLRTADGSVSTTVLLAEVGSDRVARIRIKDFFPGVEANATQVAAAGLVDSAYMAKVSSISFESAATAVTGAKTFTTHIKQVTLHGVDTVSLCQ